MAVAALVVSIVSVVAAVAAGIMAAIAVRISSRSAAESRRSAEAAEASIAGSRASAEAAERVLEIERQWIHEEMRPQLEGCVVPSPAQPKEAFAQQEGEGKDEEGEGGYGYRLEVWLKTRLPLVSVWLQVPENAGFYQRTPGEAFSLWYAYSKRRSVLKPGEVLTWPVHRSENAHGTVTAVASCRGEDGTVWEDIAVPISLGNP